MMRDSYDSEIEEREQIERLKVVQLALRLGCQYRPFCGCAADAPDRSVNRLAIGRHSCEAL